MFCDHFRIKSEISSIKDTWRAPKYLEITQSTSNQPMGQGEIPRKKRKYFELKDHQDQTY